MAAIVQPTFTIPVDSENKAKSLNIFSFSFPPPCFLPHVVDRLLRVLRVHLRGRTHGGDHPRGPRAHQAQPRRRRPRRRHRHHHRPCHHGIRLRRGRTALRLVHRPPALRSVLLLHVLRRRRRRLPDLPPRHRSRSVHLRGVPVLDVLHVQRQVRRHRQRHRRGLG